MQERAPGKSKPGLLTAAMKGRCEVAGLQRRWQAWLNRLRDDLEEGRMYDAEEWRLDALSLTLNWAHSREELPQQPKGNAVEVSKRLFSKYASKSATQSVLSDSALSAPEVWLNSA